LNFLTDAVEWDKQAEQLENYKVSTEMLSVFSLLAGKTGKDLGNRQGDERKCVAVPSVSNIYRRQSRSSSMGINSGLHEHY
jgi:hypothetical protein